MVLVTSVKPRSSFQLVVRVVAIELDYKRAVFLPPGDFAIAYSSRDKIGSLDGQGNKCIKPSTVGAS